LGQTDAALQILQTGLQRAPAAILAYQTLGSYYQSQQDHSAALQSYQEGLDIMPGAAELKVDQGNVYVGEFQAAKQELANANAYYQFALDRYNKTLLMPNLDWTVQIKADALANFQHAQSYLAYAQAGFEQAQSLPETAQAEFQQALVIQPNSTSAFIGLGKVAEINAQWNEAIQYYQQGLSINPYSADVWNALGQVYLLKGLAEEARNAYQNAINISPNNVQASTGIITATQTLSSWSIAQALDNVAYSQNKWQAIIEYIRNSNP
jgi:superkiller protein 3